MTTLLYRGHTYEQSHSAGGHAQQLRYDRSVYAERQQQIRSPHQLTYRGCSYISDPAMVSPLSGQFVYRGVGYSR